MSDFLTITAFLRRLRSKKTLSPSGVDCCARAGSRMPDAPTVATVDQIIAVEWETWQWECGQSAVGDSIERDAVWSDIEALIRRVVAQCAKTEARPVAGAPTRERLIRVIERNIEECRPLDRLDASTFIADAILAIFTPHLEALQADNAELNRALGVEVECVSDLRAQLAAAEGRVRELKQNADFLRESVDECHAMISRKTAEFQLHREYDG